MLPLLGKPTLFSVLSKAVVCVALFGCWVLEETEEAPHMLVVESLHLRTHFLILLSFCARVCIHVGYLGMWVFGG